MADVKSKMHRKAEYNDAIIRSTFIHLPGVGPRTEESLWSQGLTTWEDFLEVGHVRGVSGPRKARLDVILRECVAALGRGRLGPILEGLPFNEIWRLYPVIRHGARYLDIETDGLSHWSRVTVVGVARPGVRGLVHRALVRGRDLDASNIRTALKGATVIVTFNGSTFDLPMIRREFGEVIPQVPHLDLRHLSRRLGMRGGLKAIERKVGIYRDAEVQAIAGDDAVRLWRTWERKGHKRALELLLDYNREDVVNLAPLMSILFDLLERRHLERLNSSTGYI